MKMTNSEMLTTINRIVAMQDREDNRSEKIFDNRIRVLYAIKKNKEKLLQLLKPYEESRKDLLKKYNIEEAQIEGRVEIKKECRKKWNDAMVDLLGIEVEVEVHKINFADIEGLSLSLNDMEAIEFMINEPEKTVE